MIQQGVEDPEGSNELRKMQLRELALLNGACGAYEGMGHTTGDCKARRTGDWQQ